MVVLQVLPALVSGGVERGTIEIVQALARAGATPLVASAGGPMVPQVERAGGRHLTLRLATRDPLNIWLNAGRLARLIRAEGVDIVHARSRAPAWSALLAARRTGRHFVTTYHGAYHEDAPLKRAYNAVMARGERVIAISDFIARLVAERHHVTPDRLRVIPRGVDTAAFDPDAVSGDRVHRLAHAWRLPEGARVVLLPARLSRWKGHATVIEALARSARRDLVGVFVGAGKRRYAASLVRHAERLGLDGRLRLVGRTDDMPAALMLADVVVHASTEPEAFGRVVVEAQAMRRPVIASALGGPAETVRDGETGWLVPPGDAAALAETIDGVLGLDDPSRNLVADAGRASVLAHYTVEQMQDATIATYRELLG